jgi:hypothetical protein
VERPEAGSVGGKTTDARPENRVAFGAPGEFVALGQAGSDAYVGLETFENPGVARVEMTSDELSAVCPITGQPDLYVATIEYEPVALCLESK